MNERRAHADIALKNINALIGVATYQIRNMLPEPSEIVRRLRIFEEQA